MGRAHRPSSRQCNNNSANSKVKCQCNLKINNTSPREKHLVNLETNAKDVILAHSFIPINRVKDSKLHLHNHKASLVDLVQLSQIKVSRWVKSPVSSDRSAKTLRRASAHFYMMDPSLNHNNLVNSHNLSLNRSNNLARSRSNNLERRHNNRWAVLANSRRRMAISASTLQKAIAKWFIASSSISLQTSTFTSSTTFQSCHKASQSRLVA